MRKRLMAMATMILTTAAPANEPAAALPGWMAGCWIEAKGDAWTEECWTAARAGTMIGSGRAGQGDSLRSWEAMQILRGEDGALAFFAAPGGVGRTRFAFASSSATEVVFANPANDYPQRIRYWRDGEALNAEISLADGSKPIRWSFRRSG